jgi:DNA-nicking Smr family endonuclease
MTRKRRDLSEDEKTLWNHVAKKVAPLKTEKKRITPSSPKIKAPVRLPLREEPFFAQAHEGPSVHKEPPSSTHRIRRIRQVELQARLDLHGYTREQARNQLGRFLARCQTCGYLWVLVITGKGQRNLSSDEPYASTPRATLRNLVPQWLEEVDFRPIVSAYTAAKPQDGGAGALYVRLKRLR